MRTPKVAGAKAEVEATRASRAITLEYCVVEGRKKMKDEVRKVRNVQVFQG